MKDKNILHELYQYELELVNELNATRDAIKVFGGKLNNSYSFNINKKVSATICKKNNYNQLISNEHIYNQSDYNINWNWDKKIAFALNLLGEADNYQIVELLERYEPNLNIKSAKNSIATRTSLMKKGEVLQSKAEIVNGRKPRHIYSLRK